MNWKGDLDRASWVGRFAECFIENGWDQRDAIEQAEVAWDNAEADTDPQEAASHEMQYMREDGE